MSKNEEFFQKINNAFMGGDADFIIENVTEDVQWNIVGESNYQGKDAIIKMLEPMRGVAIEEYVTKKIITHGNTAAIEGTMKMPNEAGEKKTYAFCDIYKLDKFKNGKIKELTAYIIELDE